MCGPGPEAILFVDFRDSTKPSGTMNTTNTQQPGGLQITGSPSLWRVSQELESSQPKMLAVGSSAKLSNSHIYLLTSLGR